MDRIRRLSRMARTLGMIGLVILVPFTTVTIGSFFFSKEANWEFYGKQIPLANVSMSVRVSAALDILFRGGIGIWVVWNGVQLFKKFEVGILFAAETIKHFRRIATGLLASGVYTTLATCFLGLLFPPLYRQQPPIGVHINLDLILIGTGLLAISWVMEEARKLRETQDLVI